MTAPLDVERWRAEFPALTTRGTDGRTIRLDGPAGSQVPRSVAEAMGGYLLGPNANQGGYFVASRQTECGVADARAAVADLLGTADPDLVVFGPNMTSLTFSLARALGRTWSAGDEVVLTRLDHDANVSPWVTAARDAGATVRRVSLREDGTIDLDELASLVGPRTRLVAFTAASNALGIRTPIDRIVSVARTAGAEVFVDAVHFAPHDAIDVAAWNADYVVASAYKFFGPHAGILWGRRERLESLPVDKVRPSSSSLPDRWMMGTPSFEAIAGVLAAVGYLERIGRAHAPLASGRRAALLAAFEAIRVYERSLSARLVAGISGLPGYTLLGPNDLARLDERVPTCSFVHRRWQPAEIARALSEEGIAVWHGNFYAIELSEALGLEPGGMVRAGALHYNTPAEIDAFLAALSRIGQSRGLTRG